MSRSSAIRRRIRVLLLEGDPVTAGLILRQLQSSDLNCSNLNCVVDVVSDWKHFKDLITSARYEVLVADYNLLECTGPEALRWLRETGVSLPLILLTTGLGDELAIACVKEGAADCILKDRLDGLPLAVRSALAESAARHASRRRVERRRKAKASEALPGKFAHEINNLLMIIHGCAELLERHQSRTDQTKFHINQIYNAVSIAAKLIRQPAAERRQPAPGRPAGATRQSALGASTVEQTPSG